MKELVYESPMMEIIEFASEDVICTSSGSNPIPNGVNELPVM